MKHEDDCFLRRRGVYSDNMTLERVGSTETSVSSTRLHNEKKVIFILAVMRTLNINITWYERGFIDRKHFFHCSASENLSLVTYVTDLCSIRAYWSVFLVSLPYSRELYVCEIC
jgi:hypothetical protein